MYSAGNFVTGPSVPTVNQFYVMTSRYGAPDTVDNVVRMDGLSGTPNQTVKDNAEGVIQIGSYSGYNSSTTLE